MELKRNVAETVTHSLEPLKARIDSQIAHKLRDADQVCITFCNKELFFIH